MAKKEKSKIDETLSGIPHLKKYFQGLDFQIRRFDKGEGVNPAVEELKEKRERLVKALREMTASDLQIVSYVQNIYNFRPYEVERVLQKLSDGLDELKAMPEHLS